MKEKMRKKGKWEKTTNELLLINFRILYVKMEEF
jgi:hypothetical protein